MTQLSSDFYRNFYKALPEKHARVRKALGHPLTLAEKILFSHADGAIQTITRGATQVLLRPDRVAMQDATGQMAILQFMQSGRKRVAVPSTVHCDHLIRAEKGAAADLAVALSENREVYNFLRSAAKKYGIGFWGPGSGVIHQILFENYVFPGCLLIGSDSHTPTGGGLASVSVGVGGADCGEVMAGLPWEVLFPKIVGVRLTGKLSGWATPKDVIIHLLGRLTVKGGTNKIMEYFGPGAETLSATGKATITNMGAELGATTSLFPFDGKMETFLRATNRNDIADLAKEFRACLAADPEVGKDPKKFYDEIVEIDLSKIEPHLAGPHSPDKARPISNLAVAVQKENIPSRITACLVGSCTNASYEDLKRAAHIARQAAAAGLKTKCAFYVSPGSNRVMDTIRRDGIAEALEKAGAIFLANSCGPCIGQWKRSDVKPGEKYAIVTTFNRNFPGRNDGNPDAAAFLASADITTALAFAGTLTFNPLTDSLKSPDGKPVKFTPPEAEEIPPAGFVEKASGYEAPADNPDTVEVDLPATSERLAKLPPFAKWDGKDFVKLPVLLKCKGKTTTDHISPAGPWLKYRGHLDKISDNAFLAATNAFSNAPGKGTNVLTGEKDLTISKIARDYKSKDVKSVVIGDENYGEGSSREHAAMTPRHLNVAAVITRSFARIHETNLKKQGLLPLTFENPADYDKVEQNDRVSLTNLAALAPGKPVRMILHKPDGREETISLRHSFSKDQIAWFKAGSALNLFGER